MPLQPEKLTNTQLILLLEKRKVFALRSRLEHELEARKISDQDFLQISNEIKVNSPFEDQNNPVQLSIWHKLLILVSPFLVYHLYCVYSINYSKLKRSGYDAKHNEYWKYKQLGLVLSIVLFYIWVLYYY